VLDLFVKHYHQHPLIPFFNNEFLSFQTIQKNAVKEMYLLCYKHNLIHLWAYLWTNWYQDDMWILWARSITPESSVVTGTGTCPWTGQSGTVPSKDMNLLMSGTLICGTFIIFIYILYLKNQLFIKTFIYY
jgi:hypothetical protein